MKRNPDTRGDDRSEVTREVTGADAARDDAETGSAGNGGWRFGGDDAPGDFEDQYRLEPDPSDARDILPDKIEEGFSEPGEEDRDYTAQPNDKLRPITPDQLSSDDPDARER